MPSYNLPTSNSFGNVLLIVGLLLIAIFIIAFIIFISSGIIFLIYRKKPNKKNKGKSALIFSLVISVVSLILFILSFFLRSKFGFYPAPPSFPL
jgi:amino acid transporter